MNNELHEVVKLIQINKLSLNVSKQFFTVFSYSSQAHFPALVKNVIILVHSSGRKFPAILLDDKLIFA